MSTADKLRIALQLRLAGLRLPPRKTLELVMTIRRAMLDVLNEARAENGLAPVTLADIDHLEFKAMTDSNYTDNLAEMCASLAGDKP